MRAYRQWRDKLLILRGLSSRAFSGRPSPLLSLLSSPPLSSLPSSPLPLWLSLTSNLPQFINNAAVVQRRASVGVDQTTNSNAFLQHTNCDVKRNRCVLLIIPDKVNYFKLLASAFLKYLRMSLVDSVARASSADRFFGIPAGSSSLEFVSLTSTSDVRSVSESFFWLGPF